MSVHVAVAVVAIGCLLTTRPGLASESVGAGVEVATTGPVLASADLGGPVSVAIASARTEEPRSPVGAVHRREGGSLRDSTTSSASTVVEPATIAALGFTAAALIALRRRKAESAKVATA